MADGRFRRSAVLAVAVACLTLAPGCQTCRDIKTKASNWRPFSSAYDDPKADQKLADAQRLFDFCQELVEHQGEKGVHYWYPHWANPLDRTKPFVVQESRALEALDYVHTHDFSGPLADKALFWCGYVNYIRGNFDEADHYFSQLVELHKDSTLRPQ